MTVGAVTLTALLDTGSMHNFIAEAAAARTGLAVQSSPRLTATVANGERIACPGVLRQASIAIAGENFCVDLYVMPLAGYDVVLGTQWMVTLGKMVWDLTTRTVAFTCHGRTICWEDVAAQRAPRLSNITAPAALPCGRRKPAAVRMRSKGGEGSVTEKRTEGVRAPLRSVKANKGRNEPV